MIRWLKQFWCSLDDHGGIGNDSRCKRCGKRVNLNPWK